MAHAASCGRDVRVLASRDTAQHRLEAWRESASAPSSDELQLRALQYAQKPLVGPNWGLYEAFKDLRHDQMLKMIWVRP